MWFPVFQLMDTKNTETTFLLKAFHFLLPGGSEANKVRKLPTEHVTVDYDHSNLQSLKDRKGTQGYHPSGMSGGCVSYFTKLIGGGDLPYVPVGIIIEYNNETETIIATKMNIVFEIIKTYINRKQKRQNGVTISGAVRPLNP
jgi:hypothetical protein